ncbi:sigma-70 family RNA polymerase sigma factor [Bacillus cereus]|uniref:sigma-70 family RNA polymerase sigma factor n=1 Tax=Bacillus cereus TaxID=1396 RepID=UPI0018CEF909|nr:sigma-70 family RNA polymerase sigma factor [Bacillus cereus]MBG9612505.1 DNA-directed RNA polymerase subunit sigma-24 [Bacillus cereus]
MNTATINFQDLIIEILNSESIAKIFNFELFKVRNQDKEDVKQDCILRIMKSLQQTTVPSEKLPSFCQTIIKRTVVDYYRYTNRMVEQNSTSVFYCDGFIEDDSSDNNCPTFCQESYEQGYEFSIVKADYEIHRNKFTPTEQHVIEYMLYDGLGVCMNLAEIANELKINKSHSTRALKKLRSIYCC